MNLTLLLLVWLTATIICLLPLLWLVKLSDERMPHRWDEALTPPLPTAINFADATSARAERRTYFGGSDFEFGVPQIDS